MKKKKVKLFISEQSIDLPAFQPEGKIEWETQKTSNNSELSSSGGPVQSKQVKGMWTAQVAVWVSHVEMRSSLKAHGDVPGSAYSM